METILQNKFFNASTSPHISTNLLSCRSYARPWSRPQRHPPNKASLEQRQTSFQLDRPAVQLLKTLEGQKLCWSFALFSPRIVDKAIKLWWLVSGYPGSWCLVSWMLSILLCREKGSIWGRGPGQVTHANKGQHHVHDHRRHENQRPTCR